MTQQPDGKNNQIKDATKEQYYRDLRFRGTYAALLVVMGIAYGPLAVFKDSPYSQFVRNRIPGGNHATNFIIPFVGGVSNPWITGASAVSISSELVQGWQKSSEKTGNWHSMLEYTDYRDISSAILGTCLAFLMSNGVKNAVRKDIKNHLIPKLKEQNIKTDDIINCLNELKSGKKTWNFLKIADYSNMIATLEVVISEYPE